MSLVTALWNAVIYPQNIDAINVCNIYQKFLINAFVIFVNIYYFNKRHTKCRKILQDS